MSVTQHQRALCAVPHVFARACAQDEPTDGRRGEKGQPNQTGPGKYLPAGTLRSFDPDNLSDAYSLDEIVQDNCRPDHNTQARIDSQTDADAQSLDQLLDGCTASKQRNLGTTGSLEAMKTG